MTVKISFEEYNKWLYKEATKSFVYDHDDVEIKNGLVFDDMELLYFKQGIETVVSSTRCISQKKCYKDMYIYFIENVGNFSKTTQNNFLNYDGSEKFRVYTSEEYINLNKVKIKSTRADRGKIRIDGEIYYAATNLNLTEFLKTINDRIEKEEKKDFFIRIHGVDVDNYQIESQENEDFVSVDERSDFYVQLITDISNEKVSSINSQKEISLNLGLDEIINSKIKLGKLGEFIIFQYEKNKLLKNGREDLVPKIKMNSLDSGYDILSFDENGNDKYIKVKTTRKNTVDGFYLTAKELKRSIEYSENYFVYRLYNLNINEGSVKLFIYNPPVDTYFNLEPVNYYARLNEDVFNSR